MADARLFRVGGSYRHGVDLLREISWVDTSSTMDMKCIETGAYYALGTSHAAIEGMVVFAGEADQAMCTKAKVFDPGEIMCIVSTSRKTPAITVHALSLCTTFVCAGTTLGTFESGRSKSWTFKEAS